MRIRELLKGKLMSQQAADVQFSCQQDTENLGITRKRLLI